MLTDEQRAAGWIEHDGGGCPVPLDSRPGIIIRGFDRNHVCQLAGGVDEASEYQWRHNRHARAANIIAYQPETPNADH